MSKTTIPAGGITDGTLTSAKLDQDGAFTFNEDSADVDFRVESNGNANMLVVNGGGDRVGIGSDPDLGTGLHIKTADSGASVSSEADELIIEHGSSIGGMSFLASTDGLSKIAFGDSGNTQDGLILYSHDNRQMDFYTDGGFRLRMDAGGNFFFNCTATPSASVKGIAIEGDNELSISTNSTSADTIVRFFNNNGQVGKIETSGSSTSYDTSSDYRLKENINYDFDATARVKQLKPARFNFIADADTTLDGFIAHEVTPIVPEAISGEKDAVDSEGNIDPQGIDQSKLVPLLTKALQEAITEIESLKARVTTLEG